MNQYAKGDKLPDILVVGDEPGTTELVEKLRQKGCRVERRSTPILLVDGFSTVHSISTALAASLKDMVKVFPVERDPTPLNKPEYRKTLGRKKNRW